MLVQDRCTVCAKHTIGSEIVLDAPSVVTRVKWKLVSVRLEIVLILTQDRCTVCAERSIGSEIILDTMLVLLCVEAQVDARFVLFGDSAKLDAR